MSTITTDWLDRLCFNSDGLIPVIAQDCHTGDVLMMAWMNREALELTVRENRAVYWSRSRNRLWRKGESSGHTQTVRGLYRDCDGDTLLLRVEQAGGIACHTGRRSCFYEQLHDGAWESIAPVLKDPATFYG
ncbi:MAG TPA: phosphoribosyl-AMP cyclohydrolase [Pseudomonadales bacterium]|jgi:phosphoribosyl-AMP cyclohydrolase